MNNTDSKALHNNTVRLALFLILAIGLTAGFAQRADAHDVDHRVYKWYPQYSQVREYKREFPHWLRKDRDFKRWYHHNQFNRVRRVSWNRLYDMYRYERTHYAYKPHKRQRNHSYIRYDNYYADNRRRRH